MPCVSKPRAPGQRGRQLLLDHAHALTTTGPLLAAFPAIFVVNANSEAPL